MQRVRVCVCGREHYDRGVCFFLGIPYSVPSHTHAVHICVLEKSAVLGAHMYSESESRQSDYSESENDLRFIILYPIFF